MLVTSFKLLLASRSTEGPAPVAKQIACRRHGPSHTARRHSSLLSAVCLQHAVQYPQRAQLGALWVRTCQLSRSHLPCTPAHTSNRLLLPQPLGPVMPTSCGEGTSKAVQAGPHDLKALTSMRAMCQWLLLMLLLEVIMQLRQACSAAAWLASGAQPCGWLARRGRTSAARGGATA